MKKYITLGEWENDKKWKEHARKKRDRMEEAAFERGEDITGREHYNTYGYNPRELNPDE